MIEPQSDIKFNLLVPVEQTATKKRMLFLDDRSSRIHAALKQYSAEWDVTIVTNVKECLQFLSREEWDEVRMEHDLRGVDFDDPDSAECGMEVVRYIEKTGGWPSGWTAPVFKVHSENLFAAHLMVKALQKIGLTAFYEPFLFNEDKGVPT